MSIMKEGSKNVLNTHDLGERSYQQKEEDVKKEPLTPLSK
jgi:hypothetical protein